MNKYFLKMRFLSTIPQLLMWLGISAIIISVFICWVDDSFDKRNVKAVVIGKSLDPGARGSILNSIHYISDGIKFNINVSSLEYSQIGIDDQRSISVNRHQMNLVTRYEHLAEMIMLFIFVLGTFLLCLGFACVLVKPIV